MVLAYTNSTDCAIRLATNQKWSRQITIPPRDAEEHFIAWVKRYQGGWHCHQQGHALRGSCIGYLDLENSGNLEVALYGRRNSNLARSSGNFSFQWTS